MAKIAIFSDIHGNLEALKAVIADSTSCGATNFACLGDVVGYGPNPGRCIALIQKIGCVCVKGNHDDDASTNRDLSNLSLEAQESLAWTRERLSSAQKQWLGGLPYTRRLGRNQIVHATNHSPQDWAYVRNKFDASIVMDGQKSPVCFFGHTHVPVIYQKKGNNIKRFEPQKMSFDMDARYLVNVGSVGQPRDGVPQACYVLFDSTTHEIEFRRLSYNINGVVESIKKAGLSDSLGHRLLEAA